MTARSPIVDAQIHMGPGGIAEVLAAMDALGIGAALVDEYWIRSFANEPHHKLAGGIERPVCPTAELAAQLHPDRFGWLLRVTPDDPDLAAVVRQVRDAPGGKALRIDPGLSPARRAGFAAGQFDPVLRAAADNGLPVFVFCPDSPAAFARAARAFPDVRLIVDHCGVYANSMRTGFAELPPLTAEAQMALFDEVLALSAHANVAMKWGHASAMFDAPAWPGEGLWPVLRRTVDAFGAGRVFWASDYSVNQRGESWSDLLFSVRGCPLLDEAERAQVLGGGLRTWLDWPE